MIEIKYNQSLKELNTMGIDGTASAVVEWNNAIDLDCFFHYSKYSELASKPYKVIGSGSNLLFTQYRHDGVLLRCSHKEIVTVPPLNAKGAAAVDCDDEHVTLNVGAGCLLDDLIARTCAMELWGLENLSLIPGTVGGATVQNVGAYGVEFGKLVTSVECFDPEKGCTVELNPQQLAYKYRDSSLKHNNLIVISTSIKLKKGYSPTLNYGSLSKLKERHGNKLTPTIVRNAVIDIRRSKLPDPKYMGSAGSFFKNPILTYDEFQWIAERSHELGLEIESMNPHPVTESDCGRYGIKISAAWLIDKSGWKGVREWNAATWPSQPLVIVNLTGQASAHDIMSLADKIADDVKRKWGISLEREVEYI